MRIVKAAEMREMDREASQRYRIPGAILMENAGLSIVEAVLGRFWDRQPAGKRALIIAGPGNNGGDGLVVARQLHNQGAQVEVILGAPPESYRGDAAVNLAIVDAMGIARQVLPAGSLSLPASSLFQADLVIDALFGTGFHGLPEEPLSSLIDMVNESRRPVLAVDLPSGMEADTGAVRGSCIRAGVTVTLGLPKLGLYLDPGAAHAGEVVLGDISLPPDLYTWEAAPGSPRYYLSERRLVAGFMPRRRPTDHKGSYGHVAVVGGAPGYTGAVVLAGNAALRSGAGLVTVMAPASLYPVLAAKLTEVMTRPAPESAGGGFAATAYPALQELLDRATVLAIGPGLGQDPETAAFLGEVLRKTGLPAVIDADALNLLARDPELLRQQPLSEQRRRWVLTPHPAEMARLLGISTAEVQADRVGIAAQASLAWGSVVVLKGAHTVVASPDGAIYINPTGNPGLASGGTGDVLAGLIAGLLAQGLTPLQSAVAGVYIHGWAADRLAAARGMAGLVAGDLLGELPLVLKELCEC